MKTVKKRCGAEAFYCIVRSNTSFNMQPAWYFTSQGIEDYMPVAVGRVWDAGSVGSQLEAFAIAGGDLDSKSHLRCSTIHTHRSFQISKSRASN